LPGATGRRKFRFFRQKVLVVEVDSPFENLIVVSPEADAESAGYMTGP
jgi:hypothetical protein